MFNININYVHNFTFVPIQNIFCSNRNKKIFKASQDFLHSTLEQTNKGSKPCGCCLYLIKKLYVRIWLLILVAICSEHYVGIE